ncbi:MAG TPA: adenylyltransferase/cytidyltransferase family protein [Thermoplasmata archaeon]
MNLLKNKLATGVYWGRFNPPHQGHLSVIRKFKDKCNLVVAIGSSEHKNERTNPFSGAERKEMMEAYLRESRIGGVRVVTLADGNSESSALDNLIRKRKPDLLILSTEKSHLADLAEQRLPVIHFPRTGKVSSTLIRDSLAAGDGRWKRLIGRSVARLVVGFDEIRRIKKVYDIPRGTKGTTHSKRHRGYRLGSVRGPPRGRPCGEARTSSS